jgi:hypothetical protein
VTDDELEVVRIEQHLALLSDAEFASLIARTRAPVLADDKDIETVETLGDPELRKMLRRLLGQPDAEPTRSAVVPREGRSTGAPRVTDEQRAKDFVARVAGRIPAYGAELPEKES